MFGFNQGMSRDPDSQHLSLVFESSIRDQLVFWEVEMLVLISFHHHHQKACLSGLVVIPILFAERSISSMEATKLDRFSNP